MPENIESINGIIYKGIGGFYYVKTADGCLYECKPRGIFRKRGEKPVAGDRVVLKTEAGDAYIDEILPRKNTFIRPPVANVDIVFVVASTAHPGPNFLALDKVCAAATDAEADVAIVITKVALGDPAPILEAYATSTYRLLCVDSVSGDGLGAARAEILPLLEGRLGIFCGNTGVGKSTLLNALVPEVNRPTGEISEKLGRGRHTTREVELFEAGGGLLADTPGFTSFDLQKAAASEGGGISAENMQFAFPEIAAAMPNCKFSGCAHLGETGCAVRAAVEAGGISKSRYQSYTKLYEEAKAFAKRYPK